MTAYFRRVLAATHGPPPAGCQRARIGDWMDATYGTGGGAQATARLFSNVAEQAWRGVALDIANVADHTRSLIGVLRLAPEPVASPLSLTRTGVEGAMQVCALLDPTLSPEQSLLRATSFLVAAVEGRWRSALDFPPADGDQGPMLRAKKKALWLRKQVSRAGVVVVPDKKGVWTARLEYAGMREPTAFNVTEAVRKYLPDWQLAYSLGSGATHSRAWATNAMFGEVIGEVQWDPADVAVTAASLTFSTSDALLRAFQGHLGVSASDCLKATHVRRKMILGLEKGEYDSRTAEEYAADTVASPRIVPRFRQGPP